MGSLSARLPEKSMQRARSVLLWYDHDFRIFCSVCEVFSPVILRSVSEHGCTLGPPGWFPSFRSAIVVVQFAQL
jgi:hypothetical protein